MGFSIQDIAKRTGLHPNTIYNLESGLHRSGSEETQEKIAAVFDQPVEVVFGGGRSGRRE